MPAKFCLRCKKLTKNGSRCENCEADYQREQEAHRPTTTQRGLGWKHQQRAKAVLANAQVCERCAQPPTPDNPLTAHHTQARAKGGHDSPMIALCRRCNSSIGDRT